MLEEMQAEDRKQLISKAWPKEFELSSPVHNIIHVCVMYTTVILCAEGVETRKLYRSLNMFISRDHRMKYLVH